MRYQILELLDVGGMGQVYKAQDPKLDRVVALKFLRGRSPKQVRRMVREARAQARVKHESVCEVYEAGETPDGKTFIAMRFVEGRRLLDAAREMDLRQKIAVMRQVTEAVQAAHSQGLVHRDLKPANVMVEPRDGGGWHPYVLDFGLAVDAQQPALTTEGDLMGTPTYMAPEQVEGRREDLDRRVDVYALGAILFELLSGRPPFDGRSTMEVLVQVAQNEVPRLSSLAPDVPQELAAVVAQCLAKEPERRYASARLLAEDLDRFLRGEPVMAQAPSLAYRAARRLRRYKLALAVGAVAAILALAGGIKYTLDLENQRRQAVEARERAESSRAETEEVTRFLVQLFELTDPYGAGEETIDAGLLLARGRSEIDDLAHRPLLQAQLQLTLGEIYSNLGLYDEARRLLVSSIETRNRLLSPDDPRRMDALLRLAQLHRRTGRFAAAEGVLQRALVLHGGRNGLNDPLAAKILTRLAVAIRHQDRLQTAERLLLHALAIYRRTGIEDLGFAHTLNSLAVLRKELGRFDEAETLHLRAHQIRRRELGEDHPRTVVILGQLASLYSAAGRHEDAIRLQRRVIQAKERNLGRFHPSLAHTLNNLAASLWARGDTDQVLPLLERSLEIQRRTLPSGHPLTGITLGNLGELYWRRGDLERAEELYRRSLAIKEEVNGPRHHRTAFAILGLANVLRDRGRWSEAENLYRRAAEIRRARLEPNHPELVSTLEEYAELLRRVGRTGEAEALLAEVAAEDGARQSEPR